MKIRNIFCAVAAAVMLWAAPGLNGQTFTNITAASGLDSVRNLRPADWWVSGLLFIDLDNDGVLDCFMSSHSGTALAALNDGQGHFKAVTSGYGSSEIHVPWDINEDGKMDISMTYTDGGGQWWLNNSSSGTLNFTAQGVTRSSSRQQSIGDINKDGKADWLIGVQHAGIDIEYGNGTGGFAQNSKTIDLSSAFGSGVDGITPIPVDIDNDGDKDLVVEWGRYEFEDGRSRIYRNDGAGNFSDVTTQAGLYQDSLAILVAGDLDQDGDMDLVGLEAEAFPPSVFINDGTGHFAKKAGAIAGTTGHANYAGWGLGCLTDFDNDGVPDLIMGGRNYLHVYRGTGSGNFTYMNSAWGGIVNTAEAAVDHSFTFGDIDKDGDLDLMAWKVIYPNRYFNVYRNDLPAKNWIRVRPVGAAGNKGAAGAKIRVFQPGTGTLLWYEEIIPYCKQAQQGYGYFYAQTERHYGLGSRATVDVEVEFFPSGTKVKKSGAGADKTWIISENGTTAELPIAMEKMGAVVVGAVELEVSPNPFSRTAIFHYGVSGTEREARLSIYNAAGKRVACLTGRATASGNNTMVWDAAGLPAGLYVAKFTDGAQSLSKSIFLMK